MRERERNLSKKKKKCLSKNWLHLTGNGQLYGKKYNKPKWILNNDIIDLQWKKQTKQKKCWNKYECNEHI